MAIKKNYQNFNLYCFHIKPTEVNSDFMIFLFFTQDIRIDTNKSERDTFR